MRTCANDQGPVCSRLVANIGQLVCARCDCRVLRQRKTLGQHTASVSRPIHDTYRLRLIVSWRISSVTVMILAFDW